jgi:hypothetical protein
MKMSESNAYIVIFVWQKNTHISLGAIAIKEDVLSEKCVI